MWSYYNWYFGVPLPIDNGEGVVPGAQDPNDVRIFVTPWVNNAKILRQCGSKLISIKRSSNQGLQVEDALLLLEKEMQTAAFYLGANSVTNFVCELHLWEDPVEYTATGTCVVLEFIG